MCIPNGALSRDKFTTLHFAEIPVGAYNGRPSIECRIILEVLVLPARKKNERDARGVSRSSLPAYRSGKPGYYLHRRDTIGGEMEHGAERTKIKI